MIYISVVFKKDYNCFYLNFCWTKVHFVGPLIAPYFGLHVILPHILPPPPPTRLLSCAWVNQGQAMVDANLGSSEIRSRALGLADRQVNALGLQLLAQNTYVK